MSDATKVECSPASVLIDDADMGHTQGGVELKVSPKSRARNVDAYQDSAVDLIHQGDEVKATLPMAEFTAAVLQAAYSPGNDQTGGMTNKFMGIGRSAGFVYPDVDLKIVPLLSGQSAHKVHLYRAVAMGDFSLNFAAKDDRIFKVDYQGLVDESQDDGQLIGAILLAGSDT